MSKNKSGGSWIMKNASARPRAAGRTRGVSANPRAGSDFAAALIRSIGIVLLILGAVTATTGAANATSALCQSLNAGTYNVNANTQTIAGTMRAGEKINQIFPGTPGALWWDSYTNLTGGDTGWSSFTFIAVSSGYTSFRWGSTSTNSMNVADGPSYDMTYTCDGVDPTAANASVGAAYNTGGGSVSIDLSGSVGYADKVRPATAPAHGTLDVAVGSDAAGKTLVYTPAVGFRGSDTFTYYAVASDGVLSNSAATVTVTVGNPTLSIALTGSGATAGAALSGHAVTASGGTAPYTCATSPASGSLPAGVALGADCSLSGTPTQAGTFGFTVAVSDSSTGTGPYTQTSGSLSLTVAQATPSIALAASSTTPTVGASVTLTATLTGGASPSGTVTFKDGATTLGTATVSGGTAVFATSALAVGAHTLTAVYGGDGANATATSTAVTVTVGQATPSIALAASSTTPTVGASVTLTATLTGGAAPSGTVTFKDGATTLGTATVSGGTATFATSTLTVGAHALTAVYGGDGANATATSTAVTVTVGQATPSIALAASSTTPTVGASVTLTATLTGGASPSGTVTFKDGATTLGTATVSGGTATFATSTLTVGAHALTAVYGGDSANATATSTAVTVTVGQATPSIALAASSTSPTVGASVTLTATLTGGASPSGTVTFKDGATTLGTAPVSGGTATFATSTLAVGAHALTAVYGGDVTNATATSTAVTVTVGKATPSIALSSSSTTVMQGLSVTFTATVSGGVAPTGSVTFRDGAAVLSTVPLAGGTASWSGAGLTIGAHTITAAYSGDGFNASVTSSPLAVTVGARPDPSADPTVKAAVTSQVATASRFAQSQIDNTVGRLEAIHDESDDDGEGGDGSGSGRDATSPNGGGGPSPSAGAPRHTAFAGPDEASGALAFDDEAASGRAQQSDAGRAIERITRTFALMEKKANLPFRPWTAGSFAFGRLKVDGSYDNRFSTAGLTIGFDKKLADGLTGGLALGYGANHATFGSDGSQEDATAYTAMLYGSWRVMPKVFLDVVGGWGRLRFEEKRWSSAGGVLLSGTRDGHEAFGSLGLTRRATWGDWKISSYARVDLTKVMLDGYRENGSSLWALAYDPLDTTTVSASVGLEAHHDIPMEWGKLTPGGRIEFRHAFEGGFTQRLGYADVGTMPFSIAGTPTVRDALTGGLSLKATVLGDLNLALDYLVTSDTHTVTGQRIGASVRAAF